MYPCTARMIMMKIRSFLHGRKGALHGSGRRRQGRLNKVINSIPMALRASLFLPSVRTTTGN